MEFIAALMKALGLLVIVAAVILTPLVYAAGGYFTGWILSHVFLFAGDWIVQGAALLGVDLPREALPVLGALLAFVGSFFKSSHSHKSSDKE